MKTSALKEGFFYFSQIFLLCNKSPFHGTNEITAYLSTEKEVAMNELAQVYKDIQPKLFTFFYTKTSNYATAEDLTQDVFYEASKNLHRFRGDSSISTWLFSIAHNLLKKHYRSRHYEKKATDQLETTPPYIFSTEQLVELQDQSRLLLEKIHELDDTSKEIILLRIYGELSFKEIALLIGKTENYVRVIFHRLKIKLQKEMEGLL